MHRFEIGITEQVPAWQRILSQEQIVYRLWDKTFSETTPRVMIVSHPLSEEETKGFRDYLERGGGVLTDFSNLARLVPEFKYDQVEIIHYIEPQPVPVFAGIGLIDLELPGYCSNQANTGRLDNQGAALYCGPVGGGYVIGIPFDLEKALHDKRRSLKAFYWDSAEMPYEEVATVSHHYIRRLCVNALRELCRQVKLPYAHLWYYPEFKRTAFTFRVDGDFASPEQFEKTMALADKHRLKFSWFVNTKAQRSLTGRFAEWAKQGHDIQLHCYEHKVYDDLEHNLQNLRTGVEVLTRSGLKPVGFAAPFGHWNEHLNRALQELNFKYSSEFGLVYDDFPGFPWVEHEFSRVLQIPVHPIGCGRLLQAHLKGEGIVAYFKDYFRHRYAGGEPLLIYDHPHRVAENYETFDHLLGIVDKATDVWQTTLTGFYEWWQRRGAIEYEISGNNNRIVIEAEYAPEVAIHVIDREQEALIPLMSHEFDTNDLNWKPVKYDYPYKPEMLKTRKLGRHLWLREQVWKAGRLLKH